MPRVVYRTIPTSNHNNKDPNGNFFLLYIVLFLHQTTTSSFSCSFYTELYIVLFLHQTTTVTPPQETYKRLYIVLFLHQTTTSRRWVSKKRWLYIVLFLHQTTTSATTCLATTSCISYYSYIKPQLDLRYTFVKNVVYRTIPTSNHNP